MFQQRADEITGVLLDLTMPHMNGEEAFRAMRRIRADVPVILPAVTRNRILRHNLPEKASRGSSRNHSALRSSSNSFVWYCRIGCHDGPLVSLRVAAERPSLSDDSPVLAPGGH